MRKIGRRYIQEAEEMNITAFMNLMVVLVPFLLIGAVFSRLTVVELGLPDPDTLQSQEQIKLALELVVRKDSVDIQDARLGLIRRIENGANGVQWKSLRDVLIEVKRRFPNERGITLLLEPSIDYKTLIKAMDYVRSADVAQGVSVETIELFPDIALGAANVADAQASQ